jgi:hypothetical protein
VAVHFDGSGDEGVSEDIKCYATEDYAYEESEVHEVNFAEVSRLADSQISFRLVATLTSAGCFVG